MKKHKKIHRRIYYDQFEISELPEEALVDQVLCEKSYAEYIRQAWHVLEPNKGFIWNWHLDCISEHLEAVTAKEINYLIINIPPRHTKSITATVAWPTWEWGPKKLPEYRYVCSSYSQALSTRDCRKSRNLIQSKWYQDRWGDRYTLSYDQNAKTRYDNDQRGFRIATSVTGMGTGEGGERIIVDDPHNVLEAESETKRKEVNLWWDESMSSRIDDEKIGAYVIIAQRTHHDDLCGHIISKWEAGEIPNLTKLILPARYEKERELNLQTRTPLPSYFEKRFGKKKVDVLKEANLLIDEDYEKTIKSIDAYDPRIKDGEILDYSRFDESSMVARENRMTAYSRAGQLQQRPHPRGGGMFKIENFGFIKTVPQWPSVAKAVRYWDKAATEGGGCMSAGVLMFEMNDQWVGPQFIIADVVFGHWSSATRNIRMKQEAENDGIKVYVYTEQEPGSGGKESAETTIKMLAGWRVEADKVTGSKEVRAEPYAAQVEINNVAYVHNTNWNKEFLQQHEHFPTGSSLKDIVDAAAGAFAKLTLVKRKKAGAWGR